jgi:hypothetical protein
MAARYVESHDSADVMVEELETAELLLVAALRSFAVQCGNPAGPHRDWRDGFRAAAIDACAIPAFNALFEIISVAALRPLDVRCPHCRFLGDDERRFLRLETLLQQLRTHAAERILAEWLPMMAARMAMLPAQGLANAMTRTGLLLPVRDNEPIISYRRGSLSACVDRGLALLQ